jgi:hypothetical protein
MAEVSHSDSFFDGLKALVEAAFPKHCRNCGKVFETASQFIAETTSLYQDITGLKQSVDDDNLTIVEVYRNCPCGSTLMDFFSNRRDSSEDGARRRGLFNKLLPHLESKGLNEKESRNYLLRVLRGQATNADRVLINGRKQSGA